VLDRASTFADPEIVQLLKTRFVPVAIDQAYQRRQKDSEGEFYRQIAGKGPRSDFESTTQGFYIATAAGDLLLYNNNRDPAKVRRLMQEKLAAFEASGARDAKVASIETATRDARWAVEPPEGGLVVRVQARVLGGYEPTSDRWRRIFQSALARDNLWVTKSEHRDLARGVVAESLAKRIARYHLVDNTRGEPPMWSENEIQTLELRIEKGELLGAARLSKGDGSRSYDAKLRGVIETHDGKVTRFDLVALGDFEGEGQYTRGAPKGRFPFAVAFTLADASDIADRVPPQGSRGWVAGYLR